MTTTPPKNSDLGVRAASAVVMLAVAGTALWLGGTAWTVFVAAVALGVLWEWWGLVVRFTSSWMRRIAWLIAGVFYLGLASQYLIVQLAPGREMQVLTVLLAVFAVDIGAYLVGRTLGGPKIAPLISPSKTWSGLIGGFLAASFAFFAMDYFRDSLTFPIHTYVILGLDNGLKVAIIAQSGDFFESWMKRRAGVKDSGNLIPGHGGLFDRVDGLLAVCFVLGIVMLASGGLG